MAIALGLFSYYSGGIDKYSGIMGYIMSTGSGLLLASDDSTSITPVGVTPTENYTLSKAF